MIAREIRIYCEHLKNRKNRYFRSANVAVFHFGRCGSGVIGEMLSNHPDIHWDFELFERVTQGLVCETALTNNPSELIELRMWSKGLRVYGFETKTLEFVHLRKEIINLTLASYIRILKELGFNYFILLERRNYLKQVVSRNVCLAQRKWHIDNQQDVSKTPVTIELTRHPIAGITKTIKELFGDYDHAYKEHLELLKSEKFLHLCYEDDIECSPLKAYDKIVEFLALNSTYRPDVRLKKQNPFPLTELILNYDEVKSYLDGSMYSWMLNE